ncbi:prostaglandin E receptor 1c (subtype EP1) [Lampris incognitus]|uniref:prostaglandin E receptor 1c (subtype EP1) n=1 Tax=Lampris incognitus TaxID=2546036 RepID=UPI0024B5A576|nr:prostaglandin E receptor 1c (subtype EP1) [Lampris incognitus]
MASLSTQSGPSALHLMPEMNSTEYPCPLSANISTKVTVKSTGLAMSCFTMIFGAISNLAALGILAKSHIRFRRQAKAPFLLLAGALLLADLGGHMIPGSFAMYLHMDHSQRHKAMMKAAQPTKVFCQIFGASMVFFGLCPLLLGGAMAVERCVGITQPLLHTAMITVTHIRLAVLLLFSLALLLAVLPLFNVGTYTTQYPGTWCFLPIHGPRTVTDTNLALAFSCLGLLALTLSLLCNISSVLALVRSRVSSKSVKPTSTARCNRRTPSLATSSSSSFCSLEVEMMAQLAVITVVSCVCWSPFLFHVVVSVTQFYQSSDASVHQSGRGILLGLRMASWNQILDPWVYIILRRAVLHRVFRALHTKRSTLRKSSSCADSRRQALSLH